MPTYSKKTWSSEEVATSTGFNQMSDNIELSIRNLVSDMVFCTGTKTLTFGGVANITTAAVTFSSDTDNGDPGYSGTPMVWGIVFADGSITLPTSVVELGFYSPSTSGFTLSLRAETIPASGRGAKIRWFALGVV